MDDGTEFVTELGSWVVCILLLLLEEVVMHALHFVHVSNHDVQVPKHLLVVSHFALRQLLAHQHDGAELHEHVAASPTPLNIDTTFDSSSKNFITDAAGEQQHLHHHPSRGSTSSGSSSSNNTTRAVRGADLANRTYENISSMVSLPTMANETNTGFYGMMFDMTKQK